jgi:hypothetical protein
VIDDERAVAFVEAIDVIETVLRRLDNRRHGTPARLELSRYERRWVAQVMADPLRHPLVCHGVDPIDAVCTLAELIAAGARV